MTSTPPAQAADRLYPVHRRLAVAALGAAARHGFALGGGNALLAHQVINRNTVDVNLLTNRHTGVRAAAGPVAHALRRDGFTVQPGRDDGAPLPHGQAGWTVTGPGISRTFRTFVQLACSPRGRDPVMMEVGPVLHLQDAAGGKVCALAGRGEVRDYADTAALLGRWTPAELIGFARRVDPGLDRRALAQAARRLDQMPDQAFGPYGQDFPWIPNRRAALVRERFAAWPRDARAITGQDQMARPPARQHRAAPGRIRSQEPDRDR